MTTVSIDHKYAGFISIERISCNELDHLLWKLWGLEVKSIHHFSPLCFVSKISLRLMLDHGSICLDILSNYYENFLAPELNTFHISTTTTTDPTASLLYSTPSSTIWANAINYPWPSPSKTPESPPPPSISPHQESSSRETTKNAPLHFSDS